MYAEMLAKRMIKTKAPKYARETWLIVDESTIDEIYEMMTDVHTISEDLTVKEIEIHVDTALAVWRDQTKGRG